MAIITAARTKVEEVIGAVLPADTTQWHMSEMNRENWRLLIQNQEQGVSTGRQLFPPYCIFDWGDPQPFEGATTATCYRLPLSWYYITGINPTDNTPAKDPQEYLAEIEGVLQAVVTALRAASTDDFNVWDFSPSLSKSLDPNRVFLNFNAPFWAGCLDTFFAVGETV